MKNKDIVKLYETICKIIDDKEIKIGVKDSYTLIKNKHEIENSYNSIIEMRKNIILEYGEEDDGEVKIPKERMEELNSKLNELNNIENEIKLFHISINGLESYNIPMEYIDGLYEILDN